MIALAALAAIGSAWWAAPARAAGGPFRLLVPRSARFLTDSERYVAWQVSESSPIIVFDTASGRERTVAGCRLFDIGNQTDPRGWPAGHGRFIVFCGGTAELLDASTGAAQVLPTGNEYGPSWHVVGARYVEGRTNNPDCRQSAAEKRREAPCIALYDIATGAVSYRPQSQVGDLDRAGAPLVCPALRQKVIADRATNAGDYSDQLFGEPGEPLPIWRCHGRPILIRHAGVASDLNIHGGLASWDDGHQASECGGGECSLPAVRHGTVSAYSLATGRRWSLKPPARRVNVGIGPPVLGVFGYSTHTRNMLFWVATRELAFAEVGSVVASSAVYAAKL